MNQAGETVSAVRCQSSQQKQVNQLLQLPWLKLFHIIRHANKVTC